MKKIIFIVIIALMSLSVSVKYHYKATWYDTEPHPKVHREYPTCAINGIAKGTKLLITNIRNGKSCIVTVTDRMKLKLANRIDLSKKAFGLIENHSYGICSVIIKKIDTLNLN